MNIPIAKPSMGDEEKQAVLDVMDSGMLVQGSQVAEFEQVFADYHGAKFGVAMSSGTSALMATMMAHGVAPGDEVIIPSFSFFATASSVLSVGAQPVFADIDPRTYCLSVDAAEAAITRRTVAIMPVHLYGHPADMSRFEAICQKHGLVLLEDAAQAHGAALDSRRVGTWGTASFSFYPSKNITTGEGGMVLTNDEEIARKLRMIRNQGMNHQYHHEVVGYNFRMTNLAAAIGLAQVKHLDQWTRQRQENARYFDTCLRNVNVPFVSPGVSHVYHQYTIRVPDGMDRDSVLNKLNEQGIGARVYYPKPIHHQPVVESLAGGHHPDLPETDRASAQVLSLPVHPALTPEERDYIVQKVNELC
jgi:perosamine synthetase